MVSRSSNSHIGNLRSPKIHDYGPYTQYSSSRNRVAAYEFRDLELLACGVTVDEVDGMAGSGIFDMVQSSSQVSSDLSESSKPPYSPSDILASVYRSLVLDRKERFLRYAMPTVEFLRDFVRLCALLMTEKHSSTPRELQEWFHRTKLLEFQGYSLESVLCDNYQCSVDHLTHTPNQDEYAHDSFFGRFFDVVVRMSLRLMTSREGRIGMILEKVMKGDLICVLFGCNVPVLLRKSESGDSFTFIGECYLDGCMDGSVLDQSDLVGETFRIL
jgi:hypothetical protein